MVKGRFLILLATLALATGCAASKPVVMTPVASEPDPWAGFTNGVKAEDPKPEAKADPKPESKPESSSDAKSSDTQATEKVASADSSEPEETKPVPVKKAGKKKAKKGGGGSVAGKKPRKRAKKTATAS